MLGKWVTIYKGLTMCLMGSEFSVWLAQCSVSLSSSLVGIPRGDLWGD